MTRSEAGAWVALLAGVAGLILSVRFVMSLFGAAAQ